MFWIIALVILLVIVWPYILPLLTPVGNFILLIILAPVTGILRLIRRPKTQEEEDKLTKDSAMGAALLLCILVIGLLTWVAMRSI